VFIDLLAEVMLASVKKAMHDAAVPAACCVCIYFGFALIDTDGCAYEFFVHTMTS
jgi:hypothetical protein